MAVLNGSKEFKRGRLTGRPPVPAKTFAVIGQKPASAIAKELTTV